jgi:hypothetical protein
MHGTTNMKKPIVLLYIMDEKTNPFSITAQSGEAMFLFSVKRNITFAERSQ